jgi:hypothetical protein
MNCTMCGAASGDTWETEPLREVQLVFGSRLWDVPENALSPLDRTTLCNECAEGVEEFRRAGVKWS